MSTIQAIMCQPEVYLTACRCRLSMSLLQVISFFTLSDCLEIAKSFHQWTKLISPSHQDEPDWDVRSSRINERFPSNFRRLAISRPWPYCRICLAMISRLCPYCRICSPWCIKNYYLRKDSTKLSGDMNGQFTLKKNSCTQKLVELVYRFSREEKDRF